jgi:uncharacterized membrane protein YecN with MAPEG domain
MQVTAFYAALLTPLFIVLSVRVIATRRETGAPLGDGGSAELLRRMRVQANFAEYVPLALILLGLAESLHTDTWLLHTLGLALIIGRLSHAVGVSRANEPFGFRVVAMALTFTMLVGTALTCLYGAIHNSSNEKHGKSETRRGSRLRLWPRAPRSAAHQDVRAPPRRHHRCVAARCCAHARRPRRDYDRPIECGSQLLTREENRPSKLPSPDRAASARMSGDGCRCFQITAPPAA